MTRAEGPTQKALACPDCGERRDVEIERFTTVDGRRRIRLVCHCIVHAEPLIFEYDAPERSRRMRRPEGGLVGELDLYAKLEEVVNGLPSMAEHGVIEHLFAHAYPEDYVDLWRRFGHVATHGARKYTVTVYLGLLLGKLGRERAVARRSVPATGIWSYNTTISAVGPWRSKDGAALSWERFATEQGIDPNTWPAIGLLPPDELPQRPGANGSA
jgi:hypothetical protein